MTKAQHNALVAAAVACAENGRRFDDAERAATMKWITSTAVRPWVSASTARIALRTFVGQHLFRERRRMDGSYIYEPWPLLSDLSRISTWGAHVRAEYLQHAERIAAHLATVGLTAAAEAWMKRALAAAAYAA